MNGLTMEGISGLVTTTTGRLVCDAQVLDGRSPDWMIFSYSFLGSAVAILVVFAGAHAWDRCEKHQRDKKYARKQP